MTKALMELHEWLIDRAFVSVLIPGPLQKNNKAILEEGVFKIKNKSIVITALLCRYAPKLLQEEESKKAVATESL